jgi:hypothetical protein
VQENNDVQEMETFKEKMTLQASYGTMLDSKSKTWRI